MTVQALESDSVSLNPISSLPHTSVVTWQVSFSEPQLNYV